MTKPIENQMNRELQFLNRHRKIKFGMFTNKGNKAINRIVKSSYRRTFLITNSPKKTTITDTPKSPIIGVKKKNKR